MNLDSKGNLAKGDDNRDIVEETRTQGANESAPDDRIEIEKTPAAKPSPPICEFQANDKIGRYIVISELGTGGFGHVVLAEDEKLRRKVAIKFPRADRREIQKKSFLEEGRSVARLKHPAIIQVFDINETDDGMPYAVMEYVEGPTLQYVIKHHGLSFGDAVRYLIQIAEALQYAHGQTLIHRDLKPANVLIENEGQQAKLMDFGMALHDLTPEENMTRSPEGTPPYMSPEQVRGENHRLDRRTDIWGFGVMMYVMLTGKRPFNAKTFKQVVREICFDEPRAPSRLNREVPKELERICLRCIEKLMGARYQSTDELLEDLRGFESDWESKVEVTPGIERSGVFPLNQQPIDSAQHSNTRPSAHNSQTGAGQATIVKVVPKGLRSFDGQDAEFFLDLLPGPKDRFGIPESLRFWLSRLSGESIDPLPVGLLFGPSGCGKSSFVKAGLIPKLPVNVETIYIEATPKDTERKLISKIEAIAPLAVENATSLATVFSRLRRGRLVSGQRIVIFIDQFEQWLHNNNSENPEDGLVEALRQCDGEHVSCVLMVRDDFWMSATQFIAQLDMKVQEGVNALGIPLFDKRHARKVLTAYGRATEAIKGEATESERKFVSEAVSEIANNGQIIPVHLALFSQMMDSDSWDITQLRKIGGWQGIGVHFLESIFQDKRNARHEAICRVILEQLLPDSSAEIKGTQKSLGRLAAATELSENSSTLRNALELLDRELRLITPTESDDENNAEHNYQLAHDFLVNPIRTWLTQRKKDTWQGRAKIRLDELAGQWNLRRDNRFMPSPIGYFSMLFGVNRKTLNENQKKFFSHASKYYSIRIGTAAILVIAMLFTLQTYRSAANYKLATEKLNTLLSCEPQEVTPRLELLEPFGTDTVQDVIADIQPDRLDSRQQLRRLMAASYFGTSEQIDFHSLLGLVEKARSDECSNFVMSLRPILETARAKDLFEEIDLRIQNAKSDSHKIRLAVIALHLGNSVFAQEMLQFQPIPVVREEFINEFRTWHGNVPELFGDLETSDQPGFVSGILKSIGQIPKEQLNQKTLVEIERIATSTMKRAKTPVEHSVAKWVINTMGLNKPAGLLKSSNNTWFEKEFSNGEMITFLKVENHEVPIGFGLNDDELKMHRVTKVRTPLDHSFYMSSKEVSASLFYKYVQSLDQGPVRKRLEANKIRDYIEHDLPMYDVSWVEAADFCNWLSVQDDRMPFYVWGDTANTWVAAESSNGYRLPTRLEWEAAVRAKTESRFFFGDSIDLLGRYAITVSDKMPFEGIPVGLRGRKMPNDNGFFDMLGNAYEWCFDFNSNWGNSRDRSIRGGESMSSTMYMASGISFEADPAERGFRQGIRLVIDAD